MRTASHVPRFPIWQRITAVGLLSLAAFAGYRAWRDAQRQPAPHDPRVTFTIDGLDCPVWCAVRLTEAIDGLDGARVDSLDQKHGKVVVWHDPARQNVASLRALFDARGFKVESTEPVPSVAVAPPR